MKTKEFSKKYKKGTKMKGLLYKHIPKKPGGNAAMNIVEQHKIKRKK